MPEKCLWRERQVTCAGHNHILTNVNVWSPDGDWIVYDTRSDPAGTVFDGDRIEKVNWLTGEVRTLYRSKNGANCGVATYSPAEFKVAFILGPENPTPDWTYGFSRRQGAIVDESAPGEASIMDARDLTPPFTPGALRGGSHVHVFSHDGRWVSFTYEDEVLRRFSFENESQEINLRCVAVCGPGGPVKVKKTHPRNHDGVFFSAVVTELVANPRPGSDEIKKAYEEGWVGNEGYARDDGTHQRRALAFLGDVVASDGRTITEVFIVDIPDDITRPGAGPLEGTETLRPRPPLGTRQRRLTFTADRKYPGVQGVRHWMRSAPDGSQIAFLMKDDDGIAQVWTVSPNGGQPRQVTHNPWNISSAFTWSPDGRFIAHAMDNSVFVTDVSSGRSIRLTERSDDATAPRPEACVFSPDGRRIAYLRRVGSPCFNQIFIVELS